MIRAKNLICFFRSIDKREAGQMITSDGQTIRWGDGYKLEIDIYDPEEDVQKNKLKTCLLSLEENETNAGYYEKLKYTIPMTQFKADFNIVISKSGSFKINLDKLDLHSLTNEKK